MCSTTPSKRHLCVYNPVTKGTEVHQKKQGASGEAGKMSACAGQ